MPISPRNLNIQLRRSVVATLVVLTSGCAIVVDNGSNTRDFYIIGYAKVRVAKLSEADQARTLEVSGVGVAVSHFVQLGYFKEFQAQLKPDSNSAVVILETDADVRKLESLISQLNQNGLCLVIKDHRR